MTSKTPNFDKALDEYFSKLELEEKSGPSPAGAASAREGGQWRTCRFSGEKFYVRPEDIAFYKKIRVPLPTLSPNERLRRRAAYFNTHTLFKNTSAFSGKDIISIYPPNYPTPKPYKIYEHQAWFGDKWDPLFYGRSFDFMRNFFEQFYQLQVDIPRPNLYTDSSNINSDYTNTSVRLKNCYLTYNSLDGENLYYFDCCTNNRDCVDCDSMFSSEITYGCLKGMKLYKCFFCELSENCIDSYFLYDCRNCTNCFGGINLRYKKYIFFGEQLTKEEYENKLASINLGDYLVLEEYKKKFAEFKKG
ncbi:MAG: hypothetical protein Q8R12_00045, partial [bacterium]|nr:hypothetical protein [bacterium]